MRGDLLFCAPAAAFLASGKEKSIRKIAKWKSDFRTKKDGATERNV